MKERDSITEEAIKEVAEILAKGYVKLMMKRREDPSGAAAGNAAGETAVAPPKPARRDTRKKPATPDAPPPPVAPPRSEPRAPISEEARAAIAERLNRLSKMTTQELKAEYEALFGQRPRTTNKQHLLRRIAWEIQAQIEGRLPDAIRDYACRIAEQTDLFKRIAENLKKRNAPTTSPEPQVARPRERRRATRAPKPRDPRLPVPGSLLILKRGRETVRVTVLDSGFEYAGQKYRSLTAVGRAVAGRSVNAFEFFGLERHDVDSSRDPASAARKG